MIFYEKDELNIPKRYKEMTIEQLDRGGKFLEKFSLFVSKVLPSPKKNLKDKLNIKFYL